MAWKRVNGNGGDGSFYKFKEPGQVLTGTYKGQREGKFGMLGVVIDEKGVEQAFPLGAALKGRLADIEVGTQIMVQYLGEEQSKQGRTFKAFEVFVAAGDEQEVPF